MKGAKVTRRTCAGHELRFVWFGGEYIEVEWAGGEPFECLNVADIDAANEAGTDFVSSIPFERAPFVKLCREWCKENVDTVREHAENRYV